MQTQPVYHYLTWVKQSFGNSAYNSLASNLEFTRTLKLNDWQLYGSSRLGVYNADTILTNITFTINGIDSSGNFEVNQIISQTNTTINHYNLQHELAYKQFELTSYNGNVLATVLDRKTNNNADIVSANNYYPFHSAMQSFSVANTSSYPYGGANGQMKDDEVFKGAYTAEFWEYDSRLGRRWNLDPNPQVFISDYGTFGNNPILNVDPDGALFFGLFGSTSEQRKAAKEIQADKSGQGAKINDYWKKTINVEYNQALKIGEDNVFINHKIKFDKEGRLLDRNGALTTWNPSFIDRWSESTNFFGKTSYNIANSLYTVPQMLTQPFIGGFYSLNGEEQVRGSSELIGNFTIGASSLAPAGSLKYAMGPLKNWLRVGTSYSIENGVKTFAIRWGAGGKYWKNIPSTTLQGVNKQLRQTKIPIDSWRTVDPGHFHLFKY